MTEDTRGDQDPRYGRDVIGNTENANRDVESTYNRNLASDDGARQLDARTAAVEIRNKVDKAEALDPKARHTLKFVADVCRELGIEPDAPNSMMVLQFLREAGIQTHQMQAYPKAINPDPDRPDWQVIVNDEQEEREWHTANHAARQGIDPVSGKVETMEERIARHEAGRAADEDRLGQKGTAGLRDNRRAAAMNQEGLDRVQDATNQPGNRLQTSRPLT